MKATIILGAGASKGCGLPLLSQVFQDHDVKEYLESDGKMLRDFLDKKVLRPRGLPEDLNQIGLNIEEILTLLNFWQKKPYRQGINKVLANQSPVCFRDSPKLELRLLGCIYHAVYQNKVDNGNRAYSKLISATSRVFDEVTWCTFNWDVKFEEAFYCVETSSVSEPELPKLSPQLSAFSGMSEIHRLCKLHGSVSWFSDPVKKYKVLQPISCGGELSISQGWKRFLDGDSELKPLIAEPHFLKHEAINANQLFLKEWERALAALSASDFIIFIGYSLPDGDVLTKQMLLTAAYRNQKAMIHIVDVEQGKSVVYRYENIFGKHRVFPKLIGMDGYSELCKNEVAELQRNQSIAYL